MNNNNLTVLKLSDGVFYLWDSQMDMIRAETLLFGTRGIRSKGKTLVIDIDILRYLNGGRTLVSFLQSKNLNHFDRVFFIGTNSSFSSYRIDRLKKDLGNSFKAITKRILVYNIDKWLEVNKIGRTQIEWVANVCYQMSQDNRFLLGQIRDRQHLARLKQNISTIEARISKREEELANIQPLSEIQKTNVRNIKNMKWIDRIEPASGDSLRILTKPLACTYVPNIGKYIPYQYFEREDILYRMMKYQCLGKYFIVLPDYYILGSNFNFKGDENTRYPISRVRNVMIRNTYFHGMAPHIGNGNACLGELSGAISQAHKNGLDMLLMSIEAYLRSINLPDAAGQRYYVLPMGDADGNVEVWPYVEDIMKRNNVSFKDNTRTLEAYEEILNHPKLAPMCENFGRPWDGSCESWSESKQEENFKKCLELIKNREPEVYELIMKRVEEGAVL